MKKKHRKQQVFKQTKWTDVRGLVIGVLRLLIIYFSISGLIAILSPDITISLYELESYAIFLVGATFFLEMVRR